jgi:hypothetical protein
MVLKPGSPDLRRLVGSRRHGWPAFRPRPRLASRHAAVLGYAAFGLFGLAVMLLSDQPVHRLWGGCAAVGYACAVLASLVPARLLPSKAAAHAVTAAVAIAVAGAVLVPLCWLAATGQGMPEVWVVAHSAESFVLQGRPYQPAAQLGADVYGYDPYLPGMTLFGLPYALFGGGMATDPRLWDALAFIAAFTASLYIAGGAGTRIGRAGTAMRRTALLASSPLVAFPLAVSGNDLPVIGLLCLGLALAGRNAPSQPLLAGIALGTAASLKATAWPALLIVAVLFAMRDGRTAAVRFTASAAAVLTLIVVPFLVIQPADLISNTVAFPLGLTHASSPAASPLPGHLLAATGQAGHLAVIILLAATAVAFLVTLATRPPKTAVAAATYLALTLTALFTLAPATRWGYFTYPALIFCWLWLAPRAPISFNSGGSNRGMSAPSETMVGPGLLRPLGLQLRLDKIVGSLIRLMTRIYPGFIDQSSPTGVESSWRNRSAIGFLNAHYWRGDARRDLVRATMSCGAAPAGGTSR